MDMLSLSPQPGVVYTKDIVGCFLECAGRFLLLKRQEGKFESGKYGLPAGKVEPEEKKEHAILREAYEETGIQLSPDEVVSDKTWYVMYDSGINICFHTFVVIRDVFPEVVLNPLEHSAYIWATPQDSLHIGMMEYMDTIITYRYLPKMKDIGEL